MSVICWLRQIVPNSTTLYAPSPISLIGLSGSHLRTTFTSCFVQSGTVLCRRPHLLSSSSELEPHAEKRKCPGSARPRRCHDQHHTEPLQATADFPIFLGGPDGVVVIRTLGNVWAPSPFQGFVNHDFNRCPLRDKRSDKECKQQVTEPKR